MEDLILGIDIGGTKTAVVAGSRQGHIKWKKKFPTLPERGFDTFFNELITAIEEGLNDGFGRTVALSVSVGGPLDVFLGILYSPPNLKGWQDIHLKELLSKRFSLPTYVEHDGNAGALAELYLGAGRGFQNIVFLTMGTGFGAGIIANGELYRGTSFTAGEIGHVRIAEDGPLCYGKRGSLEGFASGTGIALLAEMMFPGKWGSAVSLASLYEDWRAGSNEAREVFDRAAFYIGRGFAMIADILNPERIILGGLGIRIADAFLDKACEVMASEALPESVRVCEIVPAKLGERIGDVASLCAAFDQGNLFLETVNE